MADRYWTGSDGNWFPSWTVRRPPTYTDYTYVKATSNYTYRYAYYAIDPATSLTGSNLSNSWCSANGTNTNQRFQIDLGSGNGKAIGRIYYDNHHWSGGLTDAGVQNFTFWGSNTATFSDVDWKVPADMITAGWTQINTYNSLTHASQTTFERHVDVDSADTKSIIADNTTVYRYYCFCFADNYGYANYMGVRNITLEEVDSSTLRWNDGTEAAASPLFTPTKSDNVYIIAQISRPNFTVTFNSDTFLPLECLDFTTQGNLANNYYVYLAGTTELNVYGNLSIFNNSNSSNDAITINLCGVSGAKTISITYTTLDAVINILSNGATYSLISDITAYSEIILTSGNTAQKAILTVDSQYTASLVRFMNIKAIGNAIPWIVGSNCGDICGNEDILFPIQYGNQTRF